MLRKALELLSRGIVLKRKLPPEFGGMSLLVSPDASLKYWRRDLGKIDPVLLGAAKLLVRPGDAVWDVGANVGLFAFAAAALAGLRGRVFAIEPDPWLSDLMRRSIALNPELASRFEVLQAAAAEQAGMVALNIAQRGRATNFVSGQAPSSQTGGTRETLEVESVTLDSLLERRAAPAVLKVDVEGAELSVLKGAQRLLRGARPRIMCEVSSASRDPVTAILSAAGYALFDAEKAAPLSTRVEQCAWNTIALPLEDV